MAFTVLQQPQDFSPAYNDLPFVLQSTHASGDGFRFMGVIKNGSGTTLHTLKPKVYLDSSNKGVFNLKRILENYVNYDSDFDNNQPGSCTTQNSLFKYEFEMGEEYGDPVVEFPNITDFDGWIFNASLERRDFVTYASGDVLNIYPRANVRFLTDQEKVIRQGQDDWLYYINQYILDHATDFVRYRSYNAAGTLLKTCDLDVVISPLSSDYKIGKVPSGRNLSDTGSFTLVGASTFPVIHADATHYTVQLYELGGAATSEAKTVTLENQCSKFNTWVVQYLNRWGGFDSFAFDLVSKNKYKTDRKQFKRQMYELNGDEYAYNLDKHSVTNFDVRETRSVVLNSDWLTETQAEEMRDLISSPTVFLKMYGDDEWLPVNVETAEWEPMKKVNQNLFNCELTVKLADNYRRQNE